ncbi:MAG: adenylosuccinate synthetase [Capsulimonadales bacterium]|nr:adenylosuccinate synthetase [Capsulimonadales bacterium]
MHRAIIVNDLGFGDAGKGSLTDALVRRHRATLVVRYNGGAQAAHTVETSDGRRHTFHQFGSGTLVPGVETLLSEYVLFDPIALIAEESDLRRIGITDAFSRLYVDGRAKVTTPYHRIANRWREIARGAGRHGSCGLGIGETVADSLAHPADTLYADELSDESVLREKLGRVRRRKRVELASLPAADTADLREPLESEEEFEATVEVFRYVGERVCQTDITRLADRLRRPGVTIFEGAQGVLLDEVYGFHPNTTWSRTTPENAERLLCRSGFRGETIRLGLIRAYQTRHGAGPLPTESLELTAALPDTSNPVNPWQGAFRVGWLDLVLTRYALAAAGRIDALAITCLDRLPANPQVAIGYSLHGMPCEPETFDADNLTVSERRGRELALVRPRYVAAPSDPDEYARRVAEKLRLPLAVTSFGPTAAAKRFIQVI